MKTTSIAILSSVFLAAGITSCAKSTKGKMINEWKATSYESIEKWEGAAGDKTTYTLSMTANAVTETNTSVSPSITETTQVNTGVVNAHDWTIKKDGTWSWTQDITIGEPGNGSNNILVQSGTWSFVGKTKGDDFKKNERVLFTVLTSDSKQVVTDNYVIMNTAENQMTYAAGDKTMIYTITESTKDKLEMELESKHVTTYNSQINMISLSRKITLEGK